MKFHGKYLVSLLLAFALLAGWITPTHAAPCTITSISPSFVLNDVKTSFTVVGTDFSTPAIISLDGLSGVTFSAGVTGSTNLDTVLPPGIPKGTYTVVVTTGGASCTLPNRVLC